MSIGSRLTLLIAVNHVLKNPAFQSICSTAGRVAGAFLGLRILEMIHKDEEEDNEDEDNDDNRNGINADDGSQQK